MQNSALIGVPFNLQLATTTGNGTVCAVPPAARNHTIYLTCVGTISTGKVKVETAITPDESGTWALLGTEQTLVAGVLTVTVVNTPLKFLRARLSTGITGSGGSLTANYVGQR